MADGTLHGRFELSAEQPISQLHSIRDAGLEADRSLQALGRRMDEIGRKKSRPSIELGGFDRVNAQLSEIEARLDRLDRRRVTPHVGLGGGLLGGAGGGGPGRLPVNNQAGGRFPLFSTLGGIGGRLPWWAAAIPFAPQLLGGAGALGASAGSAALGAGVIGGGAAAALGPGGLVSMMLGKDAVKDLQAVTKAQTTYNDAVKAFGVHSTQAAAAKRKYDMALVSAPPGAAGAARQVTALSSQFSTATRPGVRAIYGGIAQGAYSFRQALPAVAPLINTSAGVTARAGADFAGFLSSPQSISSYRLMTAGFARELPLIERSLQSTTRLFFNLGTAAIPFFHEANVWVNNWTRGLANQSQDTARVQRGMQGMVNSGKQWVGLLGASGRLLKDLFAPGVQPGNSMVGSLTKTFDRWDAWLQRNPSKVRQFFTESEQGVGRIATVIGNLTKDIWQIFQALSPILSRAEQFLSFASGLGGGSLALGGAALYGGYQGLRGALGGRGPSAGSALSTMILGPGPLAGRGGARLGGGTVAAAESPALARASNLEVARGVSSSGAFLMGPATVGTAAVLERRAAAQELAGAGGRLGAVRDVLTLRSLRGTVGGAAGAVRGLSTVEGRQLASAGAMDVLGAGRSVLAGAARFALPVAAISALLQGAQTPGNILDKLGGAAHGGTFGLVPQGVFRSAFGATNAGSSIGSPQFRQALGGLATQANNVTTPQQLRAVQARVAQLHISGFEMSPADQRKLQAFLSDAANTAAKNAGASASNTWESAFQRGLTTMGPQKSVTTMLKGMERQLGSLGPKGARAFASDTAQWANQLVLADPKLEKPIARLMKGIVSDVNHMNHTVGNSFKDLQAQIFYFNGQILQGSQTTWGRIKDALVNPATVAQEKLSGIWATIQAEAIDSLTQMGYTKSQARQIVTLTAKGGQGAANAGFAVGVAGTNVGGKNIAPTPLSPGASSGLPKKERGGMIPGKGLLDTMDVGGALAAPGEAWIANRHTMNALSSATLQKFGKTAWQMIRDEGRPHSAPMRRFATGGLGSPGAFNDTSPGSSPAAGGYVYPLPGYTIGRTDMGVDANAPVGTPILAIGDSTLTGVRQNWYQGQPLLDFQLTSGPMSGRYWYVAEQISPTTEAIGSRFRAGQAVGRYAPSGTGIEIGWAGNASGDTLAQTTSGYSEGQVTPAGSAFRAFIQGLNHGRLVGGGPGGPGSMVNPIKLKAPRTGLRGVPGAMGDRASQIMARGLQDKINARIGAGMPGTAGGGGMATASWFDDPTSASGRVHIPGFAELSNPPGSLNFSAMGHLPMGELVDFWGPGWSLTIPKIDVGAGGPGLGGKLREADFTREAAAEIPGMLAAGLMNVNWRDTGRRAFERGGRWGGWNARGGDYVTQGPTLFGAGEKGRERVSITPVGHGGGHRPINVHFNGPVYARDEKEVEALGELVAGKILDALDGVGQGTSDSELMGVSG